MSERGRAFVHPIPEDQFHASRHPDFDGITIREDLAGRAMAGFLASGEPFREEFRDVCASQGVSVEEAVAKAAVSFAETLLEELAP